MRANNSIKKICILLAAIFAPALPVLMISPDLSDFYKSPMAVLAIIYAIITDSKPQYSLTSSGEYIMYSVVYLLLLIGGIYYYKKSVVKALALFSGVNSLVALFIISSIRG